MSIVNSVRSAVARVLGLGEPRYTNPTHGHYGVMTGALPGNLDAMSAVGTLYSIIRLLSTSTAQVDWHLYRVSSDGRRVYGPAEDNRIEVTRHQALQVFDRPNPLMTRMELIERTQQSLDLAGESFWWVEKTERGSIPVAIWPMRPDRMTEVISEQGLVGWMYRQPDGTRIPYGLDEIVHIKLPNPTNMYRGLGPVQALSVDLESVNAAAHFNRNYFRNSAQPGGVIRVPGTMDDRSFNRVRDQWDERHRGVRNAHRVAILEGNAEWVATAATMRDMQFVDLRNMSRELIREAYGVHKHMLGLADDVNRANAVAASIDFARWQLEPRLERIKQALNSVYLPMFAATGTGVEFCYENPIPEDRESENAERDSKVEALVKLVNAGADPAVACEAMGLPDIPFEKPQPVRAVAPISPAPAPPPTEGDEADAQSEADAATVAAMLKEVFG